MPVVPAQTAPNTVTTRAFVCSALVAGVCAGYSINRYRQPPRPARTTHCTNCLPPAIGVNLSRAVSSTRCAWLTASTWWSRAGPALPFTRLGLRALQRGVYPPDSFTAVPKYGLTMLVTNDNGLQGYLGNVLKDVRSASRCRCRRPSPCHPLLSSSAGPLAHE